MAENEYDSVVSEIASETSGRLKQNNFANQDSNPDEEAKAQQYANKFGTSKDIIKQDIKAFEAKDLDNEYSEIVKTLPKTTEYLSDIDNHAISKDDTDSLGFFEKTGTSFLERSGEAMTDAIGRGLLRAVQGQSAFLRLSQDSQMAGVDQTNPAYKLMQDFSKDPLISGENLKKFESQLDKGVEALRDEAAQKSVLEELGKGNIGSAGRAALLQGIESAPQLMGVMLNQSYGIASMFMSESGSKYTENLAAGLPQDQASSNALVTGAISSGIEMLGGIGSKNAFKETIKAAEKMYGTQTAKSLVKTMAAEMGKNSLEEGLEEQITTLYQGLYDYATDANPKALDGLIGQSFDAFIGGYVAGAGVGSIGSIYNYSTASARVSAEQKALAVTETMDQFGKATLESKTFKRSPEKFQQFVDKQAAGTGMENVYISPQDADTYFQAKGIDPAKGFQDLGMLEEYEKAMQTGADIVLPLGKYIANSINTEHYDGLKGDVKFNPGDFTEKQIKQQSKELRDEVNQVKEKYDKWEKEGAEIVSDVYKQLVASGETPKVAKYKAIIWEAIGTMAIREGVSPQTLYNQYGFKIIGPQTQVDPFALPDEEIDPIAKAGDELFQSSKSDIIQFSTAMNIKPQDMGLRFAATKRNSKLTVRPTENMMASAELVESPAGLVAVVSEIKIDDKYPSVSKDMLRSLELAASRNGAQAISISRQRTGLKLSDTASFNLYANAGFTQTTTKDDIIFTKKLEKSESYNRKNNTSGLTGDELFQASGNFKEWFKGSKIVDNSGNPMIVYHGTNGNFSEFDMSKSDKSMYGQGFYFHTQREYATEFGKNIMPVYISAKNPFSDRELTNNKIYSVLKSEGILEDKDISFLKKNSPDNYNLLQYLDTRMDKKELTNVLKKAGYDSLMISDSDGAGQIIVAMDNSQIKSVNNDGAFDPSNPNIYKQENQGSYNKKTKQIKIFESANETTFLHESGHAFLDVFQDLATRPTASEAIKKDFSDMLKFLEVESAADIKTPQHEKFARYFEAYLMEGNAPSRAMRKAFNSFKMWMIKAYQNIEGLAQAAGFEIKMTDDIRGLMDRMIVAEKEIQSATENLGINHLFKDPIGMGMNEDQALKYKEAIEEANAYAEAELTKQLVDDLHKKQKQDYREKFQAKFQEIKEQLLQNPIYGALETLRSKQNDNESPIKLDKDSLIRNFGKEVADLLPRSVYSKDGLHYQEAAEVFGFNNPVDFVTDLTQAEPIDTVAKREAELALQKEYPDLFNSPQITDEANMVVHNEKRSKVLQLELEFLEENYKGVLKDAIRRITGRSSLNQQIREAARQNLEKQSVGSIKPHEYAAAERKYSREAGKALAAGDIKKAYEYKRMEYLNHEYYRQAVEAVAFVEKNVAKYSKVFKGNADLAKTRDLDYVNTARAVLGLYGIVSNKNESPLKYLQKTAMNDKEKFGSIQALLADAMEGAGNYKQVSYNQFLDMINTVDALWDMSREMKTIEIDGKKVELTDALSDLSNLFNSWNENKKDINITGSVSDKEKSSAKYLSFGASLKVVGTYADYIDNNIPDGPFKKYIWYPVVKAAAKYRVEASNVNKKLNGIIVKYEKIFKDDKIYTAEELAMTDDTGRNVNFSFKKSDIIMMLLHSGNKSNKSKLVRGGRIYEGQQYAWGHLNDDGTLNSTNFDRQFAKWRANGTLTKADYDFAQEIWDMLEDMKPDLQKAHKKTEGFYFNEITADEIVNEFGTYRGGYIPAKVDVYTDEKAALRQEKDRAENLNNSYAFPTVSKGSTMSRVEAFAAPLSLEFNLLAGHVDWAVKYTYLNPAIKNANKIVLNDGFRESLKQVDEVAGSEMLVPWLTRAAEQRSIVPSQGDMKAVDAAAKMLRQRFSMQVLALSVTNMMQNFGSTIIASSKTPPRHIMAASVELLKNRTKTLEFIQDSSDFMKSEMDGSARAALQQGVDIITQTGTYSKLQDIGNQASGFLDNVTTVFVKQQVWLAEYNNLVESGMRHEQAVNGADDLTRKVTSVINPEDVSRIMTGSQSKAFFTQFAGYFNRVANYRYYGVKSIQKDLGLGTREGMTRLIPFVLASGVLPAMYAAVVSKALAGKLTEDEDKDGKFWDDLMQSLFGVALFKETVAGVPYVGQIANYAINRYNDTPVDDKLSLAPAASLIELSISLPAKIIRDASKDELKKQTVKDSLTMAGVLAGLPIGWFGKPIGYVMDVKDRKAKPTGPIDYTRGLVTGQPGKK